MRIDASVGHDNVFARAKAWTAVHASVRPSEIFLHDRRRFDYTDTRDSLWAQPLQKNIPELDGHGRAAVKLKPNDAPLNALSIFVIDDLGRLLAVDREVHAPTAHDDVVDNEDAQRIVMGLNHWLDRSLKQGIRAATVG